MSAQICPSCCRAAVRLHPVGDARLCLYCAVLAEAVAIPDKEPGHRDGCAVASVPMEFASCTCGRDESMVQQCKACGTLSTDLVDGACAWTCAQPEAG